MEAPKESLAGTVVDTGVDKKTRNSQNHISRSSKKIDIQKPLNIIKSANDKRIYKYVTLKNKAVEKILNTNFKL